MPALTFPIRGQALSMSVEATAHLAHVDSPYQAIDIYETEAFGKVLLLDGHIQLAELDEHAYHECLVRIPMLNQPNARRALVVGGGDGGAVRELCRFPGLASIEMVEIDKCVIDLSLEYLPSLSSGAFDDPRVTVHVADAFSFMKEVTDPYDIVILDSTDTYEDEVGALSEALFSQEFYQDCSNALAAGGHVVTQADNPVFCPYSAIEIQRQLGSVFGYTGNYFGLVPSFGGYSAYLYGTFGDLFSSNWNPSWEDSSYLTKETYDLAFSGLKF